MKILIADNNKTSLDKLGAILTKIGHEVVSIRDGKSAMAKYRKSRYEIVFIDWTLKETDGCRLCSDIRDIDTLRQHRSYLIMTTTKSKRRDLSEAIDAGVDDFVLKPLGMNVVKARIEIGKLVLGSRISCRITDKPNPIEIMEKEHELVQRVTGIMEMTSNMLEEDRPIPEKLLRWCTSTAFLLDFQLHQKKEEYYIELFKKRAKETPGRTSELISRSSLAQIMKEHELIEELVTNMQNTIIAREVTGRLDVKKLKKLIDRYIILVRSHASREGELFFPFTQGYITEEDETKLLLFFKELETEIGHDKIESRIYAIADIEKALKMKAH